MINTVRIILPPIAQLGLSPMVFVVHLLGHVGSGGLGKSGQPVSYIFFYYFSCDRKLYAHTYFLSSLSTP
jgi:hypothetical protein